DAFFPEIKASQWLLKHEDVREENGTRLWFRKYSSVNNPARLKPMQKISSHTVHSQELHNNP
ncbi:MAG TPA: hypothetical protein VHB73_05905, partial [Alphaproteobacteria bacterium]|nr:hypothetical protein [Alphaproteobacteria bacterium]